MKQGIMARPGEAVDARVTIDGHHHHEQITIRIPVWGHHRLRRRDRFMSNLMAHAREHGIRRVQAEVLVPECRRSWLRRCPRHPRPYGWVEITGPAGGVRCLIDELDGL